VLRLVELCQGEVAVGLIGFRLCREVAEELFPAVNLAVAIAVERQEGIAGIPSGPCHFDRVAVSRDIEHYSVAGGG